MRHHNESFGDLLLKLPWWVSASLGIVTFICFRWGVPLWAGGQSSREVVSKVIVGLAPLALVVFGMFSIASFLCAKRRARLVDLQTGLNSLRETPWKDFEFLVAEAYRRQGFEVEYSLSRGSDGGVDLILRKDGRTSLVQCKQWKVITVGVQVVRELFGIVTAEKADEAIIVTSGNFTREAVEFAEGKPIQLVNGGQLMVLIKLVQDRVKHFGDTNTTQNI